MIVYYAVGGGLGHLTRARAVAHTLGFEEQLAIISASPFAQDRRVTGDAELVIVPSELAGDMPAYRAWLQTELLRLNPSAIYLDTFPAGILGEFCDFPFPGQTPLFYLARLLSWSEYEPQLWGTAPALTHTYVLEPLAPEHEAFAQRHSGAVAPLELRYPPLPGEEAVAWVVRSLSREGMPLWLVVHAGPVNEMMELVAYAEDLARARAVQANIVLISPQRPRNLPDSVGHLDLYPAEVLFPAADCIITACGFNTMRQTALYRAKHRFIPFVRRFDDQFIRAAHQRAEDEDRPER